MLAFVDESGDGGNKFGQGSSELMTVVLAIVPDEEAAVAIQRRIVALRDELNKPMDFEFHFRDNSDTIRERFFNAVAPLPFEYIGVVVDKTRLYGMGLSNPALFYRNVCSGVFEQARPILNEANVKIDRSGGRGFRRELTAHLKRLSNGGQDGVRHVKQVTMQDSAGNDLLQLADMLCGAVARSSRTDRANPGKFRKIVAHREIAVRHWPEL